MLTAESVALATGARDMGAEAEGPWLSTAESVDGGLRGRERACRWRGQGWVRQGDDCRAARRRPCSGGRPRRGCRLRRFLARRLPVHRGPAAWNAILGPEVTGQSAPVVLSEDKTADFVVVGAGFAGLSAARRLTQLHPGARIVVLDAGRIAEGAAGRNSGFMIDLPHDLASSNPMGTTMRRIDHAQGGNRVITRTCATFRHQGDKDYAGQASFGKRRWRARRVRPGRRGF